MKFFRRGGILIPVYICRRMWSYNMRFSSVGGRGLLPISSYAGIGLLLPRFPYLVFQNSRYFRYGYPLFQGSRYGYASFMLFRVWLCLFLVLWVWLSPFFSVLGIFAPLFWPCWCGSPPPLLNHRQQQNASVSHTQADTKDTRI